MNLKNLSWFLWPVLALLGIGIWWNFSGQVRESAGSRVYLQHCANCHMEQGQGLARLVPPLANADYLQGLSTTELICIIRYGQQDTIMVNGQVFDRPMPGNAIMTEVELTALVNFIQQNWTERSERVGYETVRSALQNCP